MVQNNTDIFKKKTKNMNNSYTTQFKIAILAYASQPIVV